MSGINKSAPASREKIREALSKNQRRMLEIENTARKTENIGARRDSRKRRSGKTHDSSLARRDLGKHIVGQIRDKPASGIVPKDVPLKAGGLSLEDCIQRAVMGVMDPFNAPAARGMVDVPTDTSVRLPSVDGEPTAISNTWGWYTVGFPIGAAASYPNLTQPGIAFGFAWRDPIRHSVTQQLLNQLTNYQVYFEQNQADDNTAIDGEAQPVANPTYELEGNGSMFLPICWAQFLNGNAIHGARLYPGMYSQFNPTAKFLWLEPGDTVQVSINPVTSPGTVATSGELHFYRFDGGMVTIAGSVEFNPAAGDFTTFQVQKNGYYAIHIELTGGGMGQNVSIAGVVINMGLPAGFSYPVPRWSHRALPQYEQLALSMDDVRIVGSGLLCQNDTASAYSGGIMTAVILTQDKFWTDIVRAGSGALKFLKRSLVLPQNGQEGCIGARAVIKPINLESFDYRHQFETSTNVGLKKAWFDLVTDENYCCVCYDVSGSTATGAPPQVAQWHPAANVEYHTEDVTRQVGYAELAYTYNDMFIEALKVPPAVGYNDSHISDVVDGLESFLDRGLKMVDKYLPIVGPLLA